MLFCRALLLPLLLAPAAFAAKEIEREVKCPLCAHEFYARLDVPDQEYEMRLDLKPIAPVEGPWRLPDCPKCGLVVYTARFGANELAAVKRLAAAPAYKAAAGRSTYYRTGLLFAGQGKPDFLLANTFLKASWQEEASPERLKEDLELALKHFIACAAACKGAEQENSRLLAGEVMRRLGHFSLAAEHFGALKGQEGFKDNFFADIVDFELKLAGSGDSSPKEMAEVRVAKFPFWSRWSWYAKRRWRRLKAVFAKEEPAAEAVEAGLPAPVK